MTGTDDALLGRALSGLTHLLQVAIVAILGYAVYRRNLGLIVNAGLPLAIAAFPTYVARRYDDPLHPALGLLIVTAAFLHAVGSLGPYSTYPWYDQVAHGVSGAMVAGVGYALVQTIDTQYESVYVPPNLRFVFVLVFAMAFGVVWEVAEFALGRLAVRFGGDPLLTQYGLEDVILDFVFDAVGALLIALWGTSYFDGLRAVFVDSFETADLES